MGKYMKNKRKFKIGDRVIWIDVEAEVIGFGNNSYEYVVQLSPTITTIASEHEMIKL